MDLAKGSGKVGVNRVARVESVFAETPENKAETRGIPTVNRFFLCVTQAEQTRFSAGRG
jgi:hypothetical protein